MHSIANNVVEYEKFDGTLILFNTANAKYIFSKSIVWNFYFEICESVCAVKRFICREQRTCE